MTQIVIAKNGLIYRYWRWLWISIWGKSAYELPSTSSLCAVCQFTFWGTLAALPIAFGSIPFTLIGSLPGFSKNYEWNAHSPHDVWKERSANGVTVVMVLFAISLVVFVLVAGTQNFWNIGLCICSVQVSAA